MVKIDKYEFPDELYYWKDHTWARLEEDEKVRVGIDDYGQDIAGKLRFIRIKREGREIKQGDIFATVETGKWVGPLRSPVNGKIIQVNKILRRKPSTANDDPYGEGWFIILEASNLQEDLKKLYKGREASSSWLEKEIP
jgi:glycine cleavage system H protein